MLNKKKVYFTIVLCIFILLLSCTARNEKKNEQLTEKTIVNSDLYEFIGIYKIMAASSLLYDQPMKIIETVKIGEIINVGIDTVLFEDSSYSINSNNKDFPININDNKIDMREFCYLWAGMNYGGFDMTIIDPDFDMYIIAPENFLEFYNKLPKNVIVRLIQNKEKKYLIFFTNDKLIIDASETDEFQYFKKNKYADCFFYIAEKIK